MTKEQSVSYMNIIASLLKVLQEFKLPFQHIHALSDFEMIAKKVNEEMQASVQQCSNVDELIAILQQRYVDIKNPQNNNSILEAYHLCKWMDQKITYEDIDDVLTGKLSIYRLIPLTAYNYFEIEAMNDNYEQVGIWINPKLPIFKSYIVGDEMVERTTASRAAFYGMNGELLNTCYFVWNKNTVVHNIIIPYQYEEIEGEEERDIKFKVGFIPVSDRADIIVPTYKEAMDDKYKMKKMYIDSPQYTEEICNRLRQGLELACSNDVDIVFAPEMLGNEQTEKRTGNYNDYVRPIYVKAVENGNKPPWITIMPSFWHNEVNSATMVFRDGRVMGSQKKYTPYIDFKSCSMEGIKKAKKRDIYLIHVYGVHRIAISICAEFIDGFDNELICGQLGATMIIVPSYSHGERDFINQLGTLFPYGTSVVWGDCCGAISHSPKVIGGCSIVGHNEIHRMGDCCQCSYSCASKEGCLFVVDLPLRVEMSKGAVTQHEVIKHILV